MHSNVSSCPFPKFVPWPHPQNSIVSKKLCMYGLHSALQRKQTTKTDSQKSQVFLDKGLNYHL